MKIAVIGSTNLDQVAVVDALPKNGETVIATMFDQVLGGKGCNQAVALARLGAEVYFFTALGNTSRSKEIVAVLDQKGIQTKHIKLIDDVPTGTALITIDSTDNTIVVVPGANNHIDISYINSNKSFIQAMDLIVLQNEIPIKTIEYVLETFGISIPIIYNPAPYKEISFPLYTHPRFVIPNETEYINITNQGDMSPWVEKFIVTEGKNGARIKKTNTVVAAIPCDPVDPTGAGDAFVAGFSIAYLQGFSIEEAVLFANTVAAISTEKVGAQSNLPTYEDVMKRMKKRNQ